MDKMMKECMKPHALLHLVTGAGLGVLLSNWLGLAGNTGMWWGVGLVVLGMGSEFVFLKK